MSRLQIQAHANSEKMEYGTAEVRSYSQKEVLANVMKKLGLFWGLALFSVFLPVVHFFLVPLFILLGIFFAWRTRRFRELLLSGEVTCPNCYQRINLTSSPVNWPYSEICQSCASSVKICPSV